MQEIIDSVWVLVAAFGSIPGGFLSGAMHAWIYNGSQRIAQAPRLQIQLGDPGESFAASGTSL